MRASACSLLAIVSWSFLVPRMATAWQTVVATRRHADSELPADVAVDRRGDVIIAATTSGALFTVVKLSGQSGRMLWRAGIPSSEACLRFGCPTLAGRVAFDPTGDVLAGGSIGTGAFPGVPTALLVKLSTTTGAEVWRYASSSFPSVDDFVVDRVGDLYARTSASDAKKSAVIRVDGRTGAETWRWKPDDGGVTAVALGPGGTILAAVKAPPQVFLVTLDKSRGVVLSSLASDVLRDFAPNTESTYAFAATGDLIVEGPDASMTAGRVARVSLATGGTAWSNAVSDTYPVPSLTIDSSGDIVVLGPPSENVIKVSGETGQRKWTRGFATTWIRGIAPYPGGDVVGTGGGRCRVQGKVAPSFLHCRLEVLRLSAADGRLRWRRTIRSQQFTDASGSIVAIDGSGNAVAVGYGFKKQRYRVVVLEGRPRVVGH